MPSARDNTGSCVWAVWECYFDCSRNVQKHFKRNVRWTSIESVPGAQYTERLERFIPEECYWKDLRVQLRMNRAERSRLLLRMLIWTDWRALSSRCWIWLNSWRHVPASDSRSIVRSVSHRLYVQTTTRNRKQPCLWTGRSTQTAEVTFITVRCRHIGSDQEREAFLSDAGFVKKIKRI